MLWEGKGNPNNGLLYVSGKDITQKHKQEKEVEMLSLIAKETVNSIVIMDAQRRITWINEAFERSTGFSLKEASGKRPSELLSGPDTDLQLIKETVVKLQRGEAATIEILGYTKGQQQLWVAIQLQPLFDKRGVLDKIIAIMNNITERKMLRAQLDLEMRQQQKRITAAVIRAQENERSQLGRELHDNVNQVLTTVKLFNEIIAENVTEHKELVHRSSGFLQICIDEIRRISKRLAIPPLSEVGLIELIRELVDSINLVNKFEITYSLKGMHAVPISQELQLAIYRILQEQLNNIIKHADATMVMIALACEKEQLFLSIKDNGNGFDPLLKRNGIGITNIKSRAESLNGSFQLESAPGKGCVVKVVFPLSGEATAQ
jgi:PAS domain S-box-containing protein